MRANSRSKTIVWLSLFLAIITVMISVMSVLHPVTVSAAKNTKINKLIFVQPYGGDHMQQMQNAVDSQWGGAGTQDANQHEWVYGLNDVMSHVSSNQDTRSKEAIVMWANTSRWLDSRDTSTFGGYFNRSNLGSDSDANIGDAASYNATGFQRMLYGYDYTYQFTFKLWLDANGNEVYGEDYSSNPHSGTDKCTDGTNVDVSGLEPSYNHGDHCQDRHVDKKVPKKDAYGNVVKDIHGNTVMVDYCNEPAHHGHSAHEHCVQKEEQVTRTFHVEGVFEKWRKQYSDLKIYIFEDGPRAKDYLNAEDLSQNHSEMSESLNDAPKKFNEAFKNGASDCLDMFEMLYKSNPYFANGNDAKSGASPNYYYSDETYRSIFHIMWNTVLTLNPNDEPPESINQSLYAVSSSLTSYMNDVLSSSAKEDETVSNTHRLAAAATNYVGNIGAVLGYGDKDYGFNSFITGRQSKTSSVIDYSALLGVENGSHGSNQMYLYARYGYLLADLGLDSTSTRTAYGSPHMIPGVLMFLVYSLSQGISIIFSKIVELLMKLNPFQLFANASTISAGLKSSMANSVTATVPTKILDFVADCYDKLSDLGFIVFPLFLVLFIVSALWWKRGWNSRKDNNSGLWAKAKLLALRLTFLCVGIPLLGSLYTSSLEYVNGYASDTVSSGTQMIATTFVDFKGWVQQYRLSPTVTVNGSNVNLKLESSSNGKGGSKAGQAADASYSDLRRTVANINMATGAVPTTMNWNGYVGKSEQEVLKNALIGTNKAITSDVYKAGASLIQSYMIGDFYTAGTWESDVLTIMSKNHKDKLGRQQGVDEDNAPDNTNTIFEMFGEINTKDSWTGRSYKDNSDIFKQSEDYASKWKDFNILANGGLTACNESGVCKNTLKNTDYVKYTEGRYSGLSHSGTCVDAKLGLSTVSLYNYLSTTFDSGQMIIYSNEKAPSDYTKQQHYAVNLIGSGVSRICYYMSCFSALFVLSIIGVYYAVVMLIANLKRSVSLFMSIPGAMLGSIRSIVNLVVLVCTMVIELLLTMVLYLVVSDLLTAFIEVIENPVTTLVSNALSTTIIGGHICFVNSVDMTGFLATRSGIMLNLAVTAGLLFVIGFVCKKFAKRFVYAYNLVMELILFHLLSKEVVDVYLHGLHGNVHQDETQTETIFAIAKDVILA